MGTIPAPDLWARWKLEELPLEMGMGHVLQHILMLHDTDTEAAKSRTETKLLLAALQERIKLLEAEIAQLKK